MDLQCSRECKYRFLYGSLLSNQHAVHICMDQHISLLHTSNQLGSLDLAGTHMDHI